MRVKEASAAHQVVNFLPHSSMELYLSQRNAKGFEQALGVGLHAARKPTRQTQTTIETTSVASSTTTTASGATIADSTVTVSASTLLNLPGRKSLLELEPRLFAAAHEEHEALVLLEPRQQKRDRGQGLNGVEVVVATAALVVAPPVE